MFLYVGLSVKNVLSVVTVADGKRYVLYGDSEKAQRDFLKILFHGGNFTVWKAAFNTELTNGCITIE